MIVSSKNPRPVTISYRANIKTTRRNLFAVGTLFWSPNLPETKLLQRLVINYLNQPFCFFFPFGYIFAIGKKNRPGNSKQLLVLDKVA